VFVLPSTTPNEAFGIVQLEAMACGKPVVSTALPSGVPFVNRDGETGFIVPPGDAGGLRERLALMIADPTLGARLGQAGRARVAAQFAETIMIERYWDCFERLVREGRRA
jgi:rhamnosyl/mannosyltransferase